MWEVQIIDIWMIKASIVGVMCCFCSNTSVRLNDTNSLCAMQRHSSSSAEVYLFIQIWYIILKLNIKFDHQLHLTNSFNIYNDKGSNSPVYCTTVLRGLEPRWAYRDTCMGLNLIFFNSRCLVIQFPQTKYKMSPQPFLHKKKVDMLLLNEKSTCFTTVHCCPPLSPFDLKNIS